MGITSVSEIESFNQYGTAFWDERGPYRTLHHINPTRLAFIKRFIKLSGMQILDIGCGGGILAEAMAKEGAIVRGIDLSPSVLKAAREHLIGQHICVDYRKMSSQNCVQNNEQYDHITCMEMLEHIANPAAILQDIYTLLKPNGMAFLSTINRNIKSYLMAIVAAEKITRLIPAGTHEYGRFIRPNELVNMAEKIGFETLALAGMDYHPLAKRARLSRKVSVNYLLALSKPGRT